MINRNELRHGNYGQYDGKLFIFVLDDEDTANPEAYGTCEFHGIDVAPDRQDVLISKWWKDIDPIPITPEWLERFGFERHYKNNHIIHWVKLSAKHLSFVITEITLLFGFEYKAHGTEHSPQLLHVHQLQNLYFALTGQELTIKE